MHPLDKVSKAYSALNQHSSQSRLQPREIREDDFPYDGTIVNKFKFLLNYTILAPSGHNTQPWLFNIVDDAVELYADQTRALPIVDPNHRELIISCGAALFHLRIAMRHFGYGDIVEIFPEADNRNLLARIRFGSKRNVKLEENFIFRAIPKRYTNRFTYNPGELPSSLIAELESATCSEGSCQQIMTQVIPEASREQIVDLIAQGDRVQMANPLFRQELAQWIRSDDRHDGIPGHAQGINERLDSLTPLVSLAIRSFDLGKSLAEKDYQLAIQAPVLLMIGSKGDTPHDWLTTGEALAHLLLRARVDDVWASFFNQPIEIPELRANLQTLFPHNGYPQILLRLGYAHPAKPTPRRTVDDVLQS